MIEVHAAVSPVGVGVLEVFFSGGTVLEVIFYSYSGEERGVAADDRPFEDEGCGSGGHGGCKAGAGGCAESSSGKGDC